MSKAIAIRQRRLSGALATALVLAVASLSACGSDSGDPSSPAPAPTPTPVPAPVPTPTPVPAGTLQGTVTDSGSSAGLAGVTVTAGGVSTTSSATGTYTLSGVPVATSIVVRFAKSGFVEQIKTTTALSVDGGSAVVNAPLLPVAASTSFDPTQAKTLTVAGSTASVILPAGALRLGSGATPTGNVNATITPIAVTDSLDVMPGNFTTSAGSRIESYGALDVALTDASGAALNLAAGQTATVRIPLSTRNGTPPASVPLFYFNRATGLWVQEGTATLVGSGSNRYYEGTVAHFSVWNADQIYNTVLVNGCVQNEAGTRVANATVTSEGRDYSGLASSLSDASGNFSVPMKSNANGVVTAVSTGNFSSAVAVETGTNAVTLPACLVLTRAAVTVKLSWGAAPSDLDSHVFGPRSGDHIYYGSKGSLASDPFLNLDVDDTTSFGPEIVTIGRLARGQTYRYAVHNYSGTFAPGITGSPARVELNLNGALQSFAPPAGETAATEYWWVFDLVVDQACGTTVVRKNLWSATQPENPNTTAPTPLQYCN